MMNNILMKILTAINQKISDSKQYCQDEDNDEFYYDTGYVAGLEDAKDIVEQYCPNDMCLSNLSTSLYVLERELHLISKSKDTYYAELLAVRKCRLILLSSKADNSLSSKQIIQSFYKSLEEECHNASYLRPEWYKIEYIKGIHRVMEMVDKLNAES